ncbi:caspase family protein [Fodinibius roseus]|nr:caspase family protein [Fodinibius roseus]
MLLLLASCTSGRWVVKDEDAVDRSDYEILEQKKFLEVSDTLSPENPVLTLDVKSHTTYQFQQKMLVQRNIQDYRLRPGFVALGLAGAAASFYAANSSRFNSGSAQSLTLNTVGVLLAASGFANLKPVGDPRPVGEERYLENTGTVIETDTVNIQEDEPTPISASVTYKGRIVFEEDLKEILGGHLQIPLAQGFNDLQLTNRDPGSFEVEVTFADSTYHYSYPVSSILEPYAQVTTELTELRSEPSIHPENVLADLTRGSQIRVDTTVDEQWYRVWYGISENYIRRDDAQLIWRSTNFAGNEEVVAVPRVPFGNIDVESNIPVLRETKPNAQALIITNENYDEPLSRRENTHRDGQLMEEYLQKSLGYESSNVHHLTDVQQPDQIYRQIDIISDAVNDSTELFVYIGGYGEIDNGQELYLKSVTPAAGTSARDVPLRAVFSRIASLPDGQTWIVSDIDFSRTLPENFTESEQETLLRSHTSILTEDPGTVWVTGSQLEEPSRLYRSSKGEDKKHHIFPYFFARALQQNRTSVSRIYDLLRQNISYTSRRLHERPQQPMILGDRSVSFTE